MRYLCLVYAEEDKLRTLSGSDREALVAEFTACSDALRRSGRYVAGEHLAPVAAATTVRVRNGRVSVTDGPFAETREQLGGILLIEARDLNDAIRVASTLPPARLGCIEVRPVLEVLSSGVTARP